MKDHTHTITKEQLESIEHYKRMFELNAEKVEKLCNSERDDIVYGFELGKIYMYLRECFVGMIELEDEIRKQEIVDN
jgi:hypothetical protein